MHETHLARGTPLRAQPQGVLFPCVRHRDSRPLPRAQSRHRFGPAQKGKGNSWGTDAWAKQHRRGTRERVSSLLSNVATFGRPSCCVAPPAPILFSALYLRLRSLTVLFDSTHQVGQTSFFLEGRMLSVKGRAFLENLRQIRAEVVAIWSRYRPWLPQGVFTIVTTVFAAWGSRLLGICRALVPALRATRRPCFLRPAWQQRP